MVPTDQVHAFGVLYLEGQQQADGLQRVSPTVHVVPEEQVVYVCDVACRAGSAILLKQPHQVQELAMEVPKDLYRCCKGNAKLDWLKNL